MAAGVGRRMIFKYLQFYANCFGKNYFYMANCTGTTSVRNNSTERPYYPNKHKLLSSLRRNKWGTKECTVYRCSMTSIGQEVPVQFTVTQIICFRFTMCHRKPFVTAVPYFTPCLQRPLAVLRNFKSNDFLFSIKRFQNNSQAFSVCHVCFIFGWSL